MRETRANRAAKKSNEDAENKNKQTSSPVLAAKTRATRSRLQQNTRQQLQNITNSKEAATKGSTVQVEPKKSGKSPTKTESPAKANSTTTTTKSPIKQTTIKLRKHRASGRMRALSKDGVGDEVVSTAAESTKEPVVGESVACVVDAVHCKKRKSIDSDHMDYDDDEEAAAENAASPTKKFKECIELHMEVAANIVVTSETDTVETNEKGLNGEKTEELQENNAADNEPKKVRDKVGNKVDENGEKEENKNKELNTADDKIGDNLKDTEKSKVTNIVEDQSKKTIDNEVIASESKTVNGTANASLLDDTAKSTHLENVAAASKEVTQKVETYHTGCETPQKLDKYIKEDGERPSTSRAAAAAAAAAAFAAAANSKATDAATNTPDADKAAPSIATSVATTPTSSSTNKLKSLRKARTSTDAATSTDASTQQFNGDASSTTTTKGCTMPLPDKLMHVISNLYLNAAERLKLDFPPRCAEDLEYCHQQHYRAPLPEPPNHSQANNLRCALQQQRYVSFINWSYDMCHRGEFPGEGIYTKIIELLLSLNAKCYNNTSLGYLFNKLIELFTLILRKFPPCWLTLRPFYVSFLQSTLDASKISVKNAQPFKSSYILEILLELLEQTLEQCSPADLQREADASMFGNETAKSDVPDATKAANKTTVDDAAASMNVTLTAAAITDDGAAANNDVAANKDIDANKDVAASKNVAAIKDATPLKDANPLKAASPPKDASPNKNELSNKSATAPSICSLNDMSMQSEYLNVWEWEVRENGMQTFEALHLARIRLERLFVALRLVLQILESDFVMWILNHHKKPKDWIFTEENRPLVVLAFAISKYTRFTGVVKHLFTLFAVCVNKGAKREHLCILERFISLAVVASNVADLEHSPIGVRYPQLGEETKKLIHEFFKAFKAHNTSHVSSYLNTIQLLRIPFMRYEFIDYFLQLFYFSHSETMSPKKIAFDLSKRRWLKYQPQTELTANADEDLSREQYLQLLLAALQAYCEWHGSKAFFQLLTKDKSFVRFKTVSDTPHRFPVKGSCTLMLQRMSNDIKELEQQLRRTVRMSKPRRDLPLVDICIDEDLVMKYRTDLKFVMIISEIIKKLVAAMEEAAAAASTTTTFERVDFSAWQSFLSDFLAN